MLAPLAGIGNWFVRLQAKRYGAGLAFSEMVSSHAIHYRNEKTCTELLRIHPDERAGGPVAIQLFGQDPDDHALRGRDASPQAGADIIDLNMGCPVPKVCKTGAGAALLGDPDTAVAVAAAAREGSGLPVTVKLRSPAASAARRTAWSSPTASSTRPASPRSASTRAPPRCTTRASRTSSSRPSSSARCPLPVILSGGMRDPAWIADAFEAHRRDRRDARARRAGQSVALRAPAGRAATTEPSREEVLDELDWVIARAAEHLGEERAARYLRKFYPWYVERLGADRDAQRRAAAHRVARRGARGPGTRSASPSPRPPEPSERPREGLLHWRAPDPRSDGFGHMPKDVILTPEGLEKLKLELVDLQTDRRREVAERIKEARAFGDISENSEYDDAKNEQAMLEQRIASVEEKLRSATVIDAKDLTTDVVQVGSVVKVADEESGKDQTFTIVGSAEAKPPERLSNESPVGRALIGRKRDDVVEVPLPRGGARKLRITAIDVGL